MIFGLVEVVTFLLISTTLLPGLALAPTILAVLVPVALVVAFAC